MTIEDYIRDGQIVQDSIPHLNNMYRGVFIKRNFYLYKYVQRSMKFKDDIFGDDILLLVYSNVVDPSVPSGDIPPAVIRVRMHQECTEELRSQL
jgi:hypothetical protein